MSRRRRATSTTCSSCGSPGATASGPSWPGGGIQTGVHYPVPCHLQPPLRRFADGPLPVAEQAAGELLSLPMFPHLTDDQVDFVCEALCDALRTTTTRSELTQCPLNPRASRTRPP